MDFCYLIDVLFLQLVLLIELFMVMVVELLRRFYTRFILFLIYYVIFIAREYLLWRLFKSDYKFDCCMLNSDIT